MRVMYSFNFFLSGILGKNLCFGLGESEMILSFNGIGYGFQLAGA